MAPTGEEFIRRVFRHWLGLVALLLVLCAGSVPSSFGPPSRPSTSAAPPPRSSPSASTGSPVTSLASPSAVSSSPSPSPPPPAKPAAPTSCKGTMIQARSDIQSAIDAALEGTTFCVQAGLYRLTQGILPKSNDTLVG